MAILVHYKNNDFGYVEDAELDTLIEKGAIYAFKIECGWVQVDKAAHY
jgi:NDP-sugar pyrophosphorylase family protein